MSRTRNDPDVRLDESLRRIRGALDHNRNYYAGMVEQILAATGAEVAERISERFADRRERDLELLERRRRRWERRRGGTRRGSAELPHGIVLAVAAVVCVVLAVRTPGLWWMLFVALGLGTSAARIFGRAAWSKPTELELDAEEGEDVEASKSGQGTTPPVPAASVPAEPADPRVARIQSLCDKILAEVESGPPVVREVVANPQATVAGLRQACIEIARRERELRDVLAAQEETTLAAEREALAARLSNETDAIARERLGQALRALDEKISHRAELATAATRLEAENTRILYTLESLHMQLLKARTTDIGAPELGGKLRESLRDLGSQIDAVAEALEFASTPPGTGQTPDTAQPSVDTTTTTDAAQAERLSAARRAQAGGRILR